MRIVKEEYIKEEFVKAVNEVIKNKKGIIDEAKKILDKLDNVDELKKRHLVFNNAVIASGTSTSIETISAVKEFLSSQQDK